MPKKEKQKKEDGPTWLPTGQTVPVRRVPERTLLLRRHVGNGQIGKEDMPIEFSSSFNGSIFVEIGEGRFYCINIQDVLHAAYAADRIERGLPAE